MTIDKLSSLTQLALQLQLAQTLDELLQRTVDRAAALADTDRASLRLFDASRTRLLVGCRSGEAMHANASFEYRPGEGLVGWVGKHGRALRVGRADEDPRFVQRADTRTAVRSFLGVPLVHQGRCIGVLSVAHPEPDRFSPEHEQALTVLAALCTPHLEVGRLARLALLDPRTGTLTRRGLDAALPDGSGDAPGTLSVAVVDVDGFRRINEAYGHHAGDEVLRHVAQLLAHALRVGDAVVRHGSDEFLLIVQNVALAPASRVAERLRQSVAQSPVALPGGDLAVTVSIGVAERRPGEARDALIERAQEAVRAARARGTTNCVQLAPS